MNFSGARYAHTHLLAVTRDCNFVRLLIDSANLISNISWSIESNWLKLEYSLTADTNWNVSWRPFTTKCSHFISSIYELIHLKTLAADFFTWKQQSNSKRKNHNSISGFCCSFNHFLERNRWCVFNNIEKKYWNRIGNIEYERLTRIFDAFCKWIFLWNVFFSWILNRSWKCVRSIQKKNVKHFLWTTLTSCHWLFSMDLSLGYHILNLLT